ncbi:VacJ family lipoprotein [Pseudoluteimonas lycopersici]|uniref:VacJ family lipoprotein n=1 Tax=Pseudoluteimonas lycopersici TaxID=1324796 RepID=A0A516V6A8_9GAMM|nr:VacJ family lipoprotein [Lysobacter lycopersici]QDQ74021.1 VacJ family lipoprotein [Lysobacter lycopersici]
MRPHAFLPARLVAVAFLAAMLGACASAGSARANADGDASVPVSTAAPTTPATTTTTTPANADAVAPMANADDGATTAIADETPSTAPVDATNAPAATDATTQAEDDYAAIYGSDADATSANGRNPSDPWEPFNRHVHHFNNGVDRYIAKPLARGYMKIAPPPVRLGIGNFFSNLGQPVSAINALLQGRPKQAGQSLGRFAVNFTIGVLGFFDPATRFGIPNRSEDFGQTLARWGWKRSRYLELPFLGPRTLRDAFGGAVEAPLSPLAQIEEDRVRVFLQGLQLVDLRTNLFAADSFREDAYDDYALTRDAWLQRRNYQIDTNNSDADAALPSYLQDDSAPASTTPDSSINPPQDTPAPQPAH